MSPEPGHTGGWTTAAGVLLMYVFNVARAGSWTPLHLTLISVGVAITLWRIWLGFVAHRNAESRLRDLKRARKLEATAAKRQQRNKPDKDIFGSV